MLDASKMFFHVESQAKIEIISPGENYSLCLLGEAPGTVGKVVIVEISLTLRVEQEFAKWTRTGRAFWAGGLWGGALNKHTAIRG